jgi:hypothetical protein
MRFQAAKNSCDPLRFFHRRNAKVDFDGGFGRNDIHPRAALDHAHGDGCAAIRSRKPLQLEHLMRDLFYRVYAAFRIDAGVSGAANGFYG